MPSTDEVRGWVDALAGGDLHAIRTGALFPDAANSFSRRRLHASSTRSPSCAPTSPTCPAPAPRADGAPAHAPSRRGVGGRSGCVRRPVGQRGRRSRRRPPGHARPPLTGPARRRSRGLRRPLVAFAISGAASGQGYLQRLAVAPEHQGRGHGRALVVDALAWMAARRLSHALVNTAVGNERGARSLRGPRVPPPARAARRHAARPRRPMRRASSCCRRRPVDRRRVTAGPRRRRARSASCSRTRRSPSPPSNPGRRASSSRATSPASSRRPRRPRPRPPPITPRNRRRRR